MLNQLIDVPTLCFLRWKMSSLHSVKSTVSVFTVTDRVTVMLVGLLQSLTRTAPGSACISKVSFSLISAWHLGRYILCPWWHFVLIASFILRSIVPTDLGYIDHFDLQYFQFLYQLPTFMASIMVVQHTKCSCVEHTT